MLSDEAVPADARTVQNRGPHTDQRVVADRAVAADTQGIPGIHVHHAAVLDVATFAEGDSLVFCAQHRAEPYADAPPDPDATGHDRF